MNIEIELWKALLGIGAAVLTAIIGYFLWKRQQIATQRSSRAVERLKKREEAYRAVWQKLQEAEVRIRAGPPSESEFAAIMRDANSVIMAHEVDLDPQDRKVADDYLLATQDLAREVEIRGNAQDKLKMYETGPGLVFSDALFEAARRQSAAREAFLIKIKQLAETRTLES